VPAPEVPHLFGESRSVRDERDLSEMNSSDQDNEPSPAVGGLPSRLQGYLTAKLKLRVFDELGKFVVS
jgi:hypothetical protein